MSKSKLVNAMRLGSCNLLETREPNDLGRFGLGLKTAKLQKSLLRYIKPLSLSPKVKVKMLLNGLST